MKYFVHDEDGIMIRSFQLRREAEAFLQKGWTIKYRRIVKRDGYSEALSLGIALL